MDTTFCISAWNALVQQLALTFTDPTVRTWQQIVLGWVLHRGPATKGTVIHWGHNWIVGAITLRLPRWKRIRWVLPAVFTLYRKKADCDRTHPFATRQVLAATALPGMHIRVATDGQYATRDIVMGLPEGVSLVSRIRRDAAIYDLPPKRRRPGRRGRHPTRGKRLPTPQQIAAHRKKGWKTIAVSRQGKQVRRRVLGITCLWYHVCRAAPIRLVIVRDPTGHQQDDFFFCTDATVPDAQIVQRYYDRWGVEVGDLNGDGFADIAVTDEGLAKVLVLLNNTYGEFPTTNSYVIDAADSDKPRFFSVGDVNSDSHLDL